MTTTKKLPSWLELTEEGATITLRKPVEINQIKVNQVRLRAPTVKDVQQATVQSGGDAEKREMILFASLTQAGDKDIAGMVFTMATQAAPASMAEYSSCPGCALLNEAWQWH